MALLTPEDQQQLRADFAQMSRQVHLIFFTQTLDCETCLQTRQILDELPPLSDRIVIDEVNFILEPERAAQYGIDRVPALALASASDDAMGSLEDSRMRFLGIPAGYEFISLIQAILIAGGRPPNLTEASRRQLAVVDRPITLRVFSTPTCPHCPRAALLAFEMAAASPFVTSYAVEVTEYPDLARRYRVTGVPKTVVDEQIEILGAIPEDAFIEQALSTFTSPS
jgi:glutaredoxin-like protein